MSRYSSALADAVQKDVKVVKKLHMKLKNLYTESEELDEEKDALARDTAEQVIAKVSNIKKAIVSMRAYVNKIEKS